MSDELVCKFCGGRIGVGDDVYWVDQEPHRPGIIMRAPKNPYCSSKCLELAQGAPDE